MRRWWWLGFGVVVVAAVGTSSHVMLSPRIGKATPAEIDAVLPASLKVNDTPDKSSEDRYAQLITLTKGIDKKPLASSLSNPGPEVGASTAANEAILAQIEKLLAEGGLRYPERVGNILFKDAPAIKDVAKLIALATKAAQERGDHAACARWATLGLRYGDSIRGAQGVVIDQLVALAIEAIGVRAAYLAEIEGGFDQAGRERLIKMLTPRDGSSPAMAAAVRRDFTWGWMPILLDPQTQFTNLADALRSDLEAPVEPIAGTFDPIASAKLAGGIYDGIISNLNGPYYKRSDRADKLVAEAVNGLPNEEDKAGTGEGLTRTWTKFRYRIAMNTGKNTLGRQQAVNSALIQLNAAAARSAANVNLLRAILLLRMGRASEAAEICDPYVNGHLQFDPKRQLVWSVGSDGKNDGGTIGKGFDNMALDLGYPYGDHSWKKLNLPRPAVLGGPAVPNGPGGFGGPRPGGPAFPGGPPPGAPPSFGSSPARPPGVPGGR